MLITGIKSRPVYDRLQPISRAKRHVIATQGSGGEAALRLLAELQELQAAIEVLYSQESYSGKNYAEEIVMRSGGHARIFLSNADLVDALSDDLATSSIGTVLYLAGSETFIGRAMQIASAHDLEHDEVLREHCGTLVRRVLCIHCGAYNENVTRRVFRCHSCEQMLVVRDHYSRTWAAFMGVKADAEEPGTLPPDEELDS